MLGIYLQARWQRQWAQLFYRRLSLHRITTSIGWTMMSLDQMPSTGSAFRKTESESEHRMYTALTDVLTLSQVSAMAEPSLVQLPNSQLRSGFYICMERMAIHAFTTWRRWLFMHLRPINLR